MVVLSRYPFRNKLRHIFRKRFLKIRLAVMVSTVKTISKKKGTRNPSVLEALGISIRAEGSTTGIKVVAADKRVQRVNDIRANQPVKQKVLALSAQPTLTVQDFHKAARQAIFVDLEFILEMHPEFLNSPSLANEDSFGVGGTALHYAVAGDNPSVVEYLLSRGADPNLPSERGVTPLHLCCKKGASACAVLLLRHGASMTVRDHYNISPLCILTNEPCAEPNLKRRRAEILTQFRAIQPTPQRRAITCTSSQTLLKLTDNVLYRR